MSYLQSLSVFIAVAEEENFTAAAKKLELTQPTVSFHMDNLEKQFGCSLVTRTSKGVTLTPYGKRLYESAQVIDQNLRRTYQEIRSMADGSSGHIHIGASTIPGEYILPTVITEFLQSYTGLRFTLTTSNSNHVLEGFREGKFPIAIVGIKPKEYVPSCELWEDELVLVGHPAVVETMTEGHGPEILEQVPFIMRSEPSGSRRTISEALTHAGVECKRLNTVLEVTGNQGLKTAIINKAGIGYISRWTIQDELNTKQLKIVPVPGIHVRRTFFLVTNPLLETAGTCLFLEFLMNNKIPF
jgi:DNA-binding transcriptional LysR family regulator